jgi:HEAT repeat protein
MNQNYDFKCLSDPSMKWNAFLKNVSVLAGHWTGMILLGVMVSFASMVAAEEDAGSESETNSSESTRKTVQELQEHLSSEERPARQSAATDLVIRTSPKAVELITSVLTNGSDRQKQALLTAIAGQVGSDQSVTHLLEPILRIYARRTNGSDSALIEAVSYYPDSALLETVGRLLTDLARNGSPDDSRKILQRARLVRVLGNPEVQVEPIAVANQLHTLSDQLPKVLHPELLIVLQKRFHFYNMATYGEWKKWWEENQSMSDAEIYRILLQKKSDGALKEWKTSVNRLFAASREGTEPVMNNLLAVNDPRKLVFLLQKIQGQSNPGRFVSDGSSVLKLLSTQQHPGVSREVIKTIGTLELNQAREDVEEFVNHYRPSVREVVANTLGVIGNEQSGKRLLEQFDRENNNSVLIAILDAFRDLKYQESILKLHDRLLQDPDLKDSVRNEIVSTLGTMQQVKSLPVLRTLLKSSEPEGDVTLRFNIALSMGQIGSVEGVPALIKLTDAPTPSVRGAAAQALGNITFEGTEKGSARHEKALTALFKLLRQSEDATVKRRAAKSLSAIALPKTTDHLAELITGRKNGVEDVIRSAMKNMLNTYPQKLNNVIPVLQDAGHHSLVREIAGGVDDELMTNMSDDRRNRLLVEFAESYLAAEDWSSAVSTLDKVNNDALSGSVKMMRVRAYIGLGNYTEATSSLDDLEQQVDQGTSGWWRIQYLRAWMKYRKGPVQEAISFIQNELRPQSPPDSINEKLKQIEEKHKTVQAEISMRLEELMNQEGSDTSSGEKESHLKELLQNKRYHTFIVRRAVEKLPSTPEQARSKLSSTLVRLLNEITGSSVPYSEDMKTQAVEKMLAQWNSWLTEQGRDQTGSGTSEDGSGS